LSSAILYVAIVAIWACVLIPRWLRRDSSARAGDEIVTAEETPEVDEQVSSEPRRRPREAPAARVRAGGGDKAGDREHARVLSSRRRLLGLIVLIVVGSAALAVTRMAAWWVLGPPSVMLLGYLVLLREASKADAERRELISARTGALVYADGDTTIPVPVPVPAAPVARPVRVPDAEVIDISASRGPANGGLYDQYADAKLRAVGD
jgi:hypothetical protein